MTGVNDTQLWDHSDEPENIPVDHEYGTKFQAMYKRFVAANGNDILKILMQAETSGFLDAEGASRLSEISPRFVMMLCDGLSGRFGPVAPYRFKQLAADRKITAAVLFEAMK